MSRKTIHPKPDQPQGERNRPPLLDSLEERLRTGTPEQKRQAIREAGELGDKRDGDLLARLFVDGRLDDTEERFFDPPAIEAISKLGISEWMRDFLLDSMLNDTPIGANAGVVLGVAGDSGALPGLIMVLESERAGLTIPMIGFDSAELRKESAVFAITSMQRRKIDCSSAVDALIKVMEKTEDPDMALSVIIALGEIGDPKAIEPLLKISPQLHETSQPYVREALQKLGCTKATN